jgi:acetyl-CoA synthetase
MIIITPLPGVTKLKPGSVTVPFPGIEVDVYDENGNPADSGELVITTPWPAMFRTLWGEPERFVKQYWRSNGVYYTEDGAKKDEDGYIWITGRIDDVLKVSGHRLGSAEIECALIAHEAVSEAAVVGKPHEIKGETPVAFVVLKTGYEPSVELEKDLKKHVRNKIGAIAVPEEIYFVEQLPKTRSGKIMRRILLSLVKGEEIGDVATLEDVTAIEKIKEIRRQEENK